MSQKKATVLASIGAGLEYYDFVVYGMMASYLSILFFPENDKTLSLLKTFGVFAIGYFARPLGGAFFGTLGDFFGRKKSFVAVMFLMAFATFCIGLLPTGIVGACLLVFLRLLQGLSFGAELPGAITVVSENVAEKKHSTFFGFVISSLSVGATLASIVLYALTKFFTKQEILDGAWRYPFFLGGILAAACMIIRRHLNETPEFLKEKQKKEYQNFKQPLAALFRNYPSEMLTAIGLTTFMASLVIFAVFLPTYLKEYFHYKSSDVYLATTVGLVWSIFSVPVCGFLVDIIGKKKAQLFGCAAFMLCAYGLFLILKIEKPLALFTFMLAYQTFISFLSPSCFSLLAEIFPTSVRYTGIAVCYNITYSIMGCFPLLLTYLFKVTGTSMVVVAFLVAFAFLSMVSGMVISKRQKRLCGSH